MEDNRIQDIIIDAIVHCIISVAKLIFILPLSLWVKAATRLAHQKRNGTLDLQSIRGLLPFLRYIKRVMFDFGFDAATFASFFIGAIVAIISMIDGGFLAFAGTLLCFYTMPILIYILHDIAQLLLMPFRRFFKREEKLTQKRLDVKEL